MNSRRPRAAAGIAGRTSHVNIACPNCGVYQAVEIDDDGDQGCATLPATPCNVCHRDLCGFCDQFQCGCGKVVRLDCTATVPDADPILFAFRTLQRSPRGDRRSERPFPNPDQFTDGWCTRSITRISFFPLPAVS